MELEAKIADLGFSARLYFLRKFLFSDFFIFREIRFWKSSRVSWTCKKFTENCKKNKYFYFGIFEKIYPNIQKKIQHIFQDFLGIFWIYFFKNSKIKKEFFFKFSLEKCVGFFLDIWIYFFENSKIKIFIFLQFSVNFLHVQLTRTDFQN